VRAIKLGPVDAALYDAKCKLVFPIAGAADAFHSVEVRRWHVMMTEAYAILFLTVLHCCVRGSLLKQTNSLWSIMQMASCTVGVDVVVDQ